VHKQKYRSPWHGVPGFWAAVNRFFYTFTGPAHIGAGHAEEPVAPSAAHACPLCGAPMNEHTRDRSADGRTLLHCPAAVPVAAAESGESRQ